MSQSPIGLCRPVGAGACGDDGGRVGAPYGFYLRQPPGRTSNQPESPRVARAVMRRKPVTAGALVHGDRPGRK